MKTLTGLLTSTCAWIVGTVAIGAGGYGSKMCIDVDGTLYYGTDVAYTYVRKPGDEFWVRDLRLEETFDPAELDVDKTYGCYGISTCYYTPAKRMIFMNGSVFRLVNGFWRRTPLEVAGHGSNGAFRTVHMPLAIDPFNGDNAYAQTYDPLQGTQRTTNYATSWSQVASIPAPIPENMVDGPGGTVTFDRFSGAHPNGNCARMAIGVWGRGIYISENGQQTFTLIPGSPTDVRGLEFAADGALWWTRINQGGAWRYAGGTTTSRSTGLQNEARVIVPHPTDGNRLLMIGNGNCCWTFDAGLTWSNGVGIPIRTSQKIPWHVWTDQDYMAPGHAVWSEATGQISFQDGISTWKLLNIPSSPPTNYRPRWESDGQGIENMVGLTAEITSNNTAIINIQDRSCGVFPDGQVTAPYMAKHGGDLSSSIMHTMHTDWAIDDPNWMAMCGNNRIFVTEDGGQNWQLRKIFSDTTGNSVDAGNIGQVIVIRKNVLLHISGNNYRWKRSVDGGVTWSFVDMKSAVVNQAMADRMPGGWGVGAYYLSRKSAFMNKATGKVYAYHSGEDNFTARTAATEGWWESSDEGATWDRIRGLFSVDQEFLAAGNATERRNAAHGLDSYHMKIVPVPGHPTHLVYTFGNQSGQSYGDIMWSGDNGVTLTRLGNIKVDVQDYVWGFAFMDLGGSYPALMIATQTKGHWLSQDIDPLNPNAATFQRQKFRQRDNKMLYNNFPGGAVDYSLDLAGYPTRDAYISAKGNSGADLISRPSDRIRAA